MEKLRNNENGNLGRNGSGVIFKHLPFLAFLAFLGVLYISNTHHAEKNLRQIQVLKKEVSEAKYKYRDIKHETMHNSTQSQIEKKVEPLELKAKKELPKKIKAQKSS